jgi:hypothetical protein
MYNPKKQRNMKIKTFYKKFLPFPVNNWKDLLFLISLIPATFFALGLAFVSVHYLLWYVWGCFIILFIIQTSFVFQNKEKTQSNQNKNYFLGISSITSTEALVIHFYLLLFYYILKYFIGVKFFSYTRQEFLFE